jgi:hypothetical protein
LLPATPLDFLKVCLLDFINEWWSTAPLDEVLTPQSSLEEADGLLLLFLLSKEDAE